MELQKYVVMEKLDKIEKKDKKVGKVSVRGWFGIKCIVYIDDSLETITAP